jgi:hypothetical protein
MRVFALRDKGPYGPPQPPPIEERKVPPLGAALVGPEPEIKEPPQLIDN